MKKFSTDRDKLEQILKFSMLDKAKLGRRIGVENQELYQIANGKQSEFSRGTMVKLVKIFPEISPYWLITGEGSMLSGSIEDNKPQLKINQLRFFCWQIRWQNTVTCAACAPTISPQRPGG